MRNRARVQIGTFRRKNPRVAYIKQIYRNTEKPFSHFPLVIQSVLFHLVRAFDLSTRRRIPFRSYVTVFLREFFLLGRWWSRFSSYVGFFFSYGRFSSAENSNCFCGGFFMLLEKFLFQYGWRFSNFAI